jgi:hypothetical protein
MVDLMILAQSLDMIKKEMKCNIIIFNRYLQYLL